MHNNSNVSIKLCVSPSNDSIEESVKDHLGSIPLESLGLDKKTITYLQIVSKLDRKCFVGDSPVSLKDTYWWIAYNKVGNPVGFSGLKLCRRKENKGLGYFSRAGVMKSYRGRGTQKKMIKARLRMARQLGLTHCVTYVKGFNLPSANSLISCGFKLYNPHYKWGGKSALYFLKCLKNVQ
jgi:predicted acetyltransferase